MKMNILILSIFLIQILIKLTFTDYGYVTTLISQIFVVLLPSLIYLAFSKRKIRDYFKYRTNYKFMDMIFIILMVVSLNIISTYINHPVIKILEVTPYYFPEFSIYEIFMAIITLCVIPAVFEEILFRGIVLDELLHKFSVIKTCIITSLIFSFIHLDYTNIIPQFILSIFLCNITLSAKSVYPSVIAHLGYNLFSFIIRNNIIQLLRYNRTTVILISLLFVCAGVVRLKKKSITS